MSEHLVGFAAFKAVGCGHPAAAGSIPVHLRHRYADRVSGRPPSVDRLAGLLTGSGLPQPLLVDVARAAIAEAVADGDPASALSRAQHQVAEVSRRLLQPVINATGVLLHTNLGRAPIPVWPAPRATPTWNSTWTVAPGAADPRTPPNLVARCCQAEAALVVNNGAAAVLLAITALAAGGDVVVSRGELVEIGGGFRLPEVLAASGARLVEVGTTNRTRPPTTRPR